MSSITDSNESRFTPGELAERRRLYHDLWERAERLRRRRRQLTERLLQERERRLRSFRRPGR